MLPIVLATGAIAYAGAQAVWEQMKKWGYHITTPLDPKIYSLRLPERRFDIGEVGAVRGTLSSSGLGHYTTASGVDKVSQESALNSLLTNYGPLGILDRSFLYKVNKFEHKWIGTKGHDWLGVWYRVAYEDHPKAAYWDMLYTTLEPGHYVKGLSMWPIANIGLTPLYPFGGADPGVIKYAGNDPWRGTYDIAAPATTDRTAYTEAVMHYLTLVTKWAGDQAQMAAEASARSDEQYVLLYFQHIVNSVIPYLKTLHRNVWNLTMNDEVSGKFVYTIPVMLPHRLEKAEDVPKPDQSIPAAQKFYEQLLPIEPGKIWHVHDAACVTIPININGVPWNMTVQGAIAYFNKLAIYLIFRQSEKLWARYTQLTSGRALIAEDVVLDPTKEIFLNIDWEAVKASGKPTYTDEATSTAPRLNVPKTVVLSRGPSALDMLKSRETYSQQIRQLTFKDEPMSEGTPAPQGGNLGKILVFAAAAAAAGYAYKEGYI